MERTRFWRKLCRNPGKPWSSRCSIWILPSGTVSGKHAWMESRMLLKFWMNPPKGDIPTSRKSADNYPESVFIQKSSKNTISGLMPSKLWRCTWMLNPLWKMVYSPWVTSPCLWMNTISSGSTSQSFLQDWLFSSKPLPSLPPLRCSWTSKIWKISMRKNSSKKQKIWEKWWKGNWFWSGILLKCPTISLKLRLVKSMVLKSLQILLQRWWSSSRSDLPHLLLKPWSCWSFYWLFLQ